MLFFLNFYISTHHLHSSNRLIQPTHPTDSSNRLIQPTHPTDMPRMNNQSHRMKVISKHHRKRRTTARKRSLKSSDDVAGRNNNGRSETIYHHQKFEPSNLTVAAATAFTEMLRYKDLMKMSVRRGCYKYIVLCLSRSFCFFFFFNVLLLLFPIQPPPLLHLFLSFFFHSPSTEQRPEFNGTGV